MKQKPRADDLLSASRRDWAGPSSPFDAILLVSDCRGWNNRYAQGFDRTNDKTRSRTIQLWRPDNGRNLLSTPSTAVHYPPGEPRSSVLMDSERTAMDGMDSVDSKEPSLFDDERERFYC